jgi:hypothetical protein
VTSSRGASAFLAALLLAGIGAVLALGAADRLVSPVAQLLGAS